MFSAGGAASFALAAVLERVFMAGVVGRSVGMDGLALRLLQAGAGMVGLGATMGTGAVPNCLVRARVMHWLPGMEGCTLGSGAVGVATLGSGCSCGVGQHCREAMQ